MTIENDEMRADKTMGNGYGRAVLISVAFAVLLLAARPCFSDDSGAKAKFDEGVTLFAREDYSGALVAFEASYQIQANARLLYNIAMCKKALYRYADSIASFRQYLSESNSALDPEARAEAETALADMEQMVGKLHIEDAPDGSLVLINSRRAATTPLQEPLIVDPGQYIVEVNNGAYEPFSTEIKVVSGAELTIRAHLQPIVKHADQPASTEPLVREPQKADVTPAPVYTAKRSSISPLLVSGIVSIGLGLGAGAVGVYFNVEGRRDEKAGEEIKNRATCLLDSAEYDKLKDEEIPTDRAWTIAGYAAAGALVTAGVVMLLLSGTDKEQDNDRDAEATVSLNPNGFSVRF